MLTRPWIWAIAIAVLATFIVGLTTIGPGGARMQRRQAVTAATQPQPIALPATALRPSDSARAESARAESARAERAREAAPAPEADARTRTQAVVHSIAQLAREHLYESSSGQPLRRCAPQASPRCVELLSGALYEVLTQHVEPAMHDGTLGIAQLGELDPERVHGAIADVLASSGDAVERVSALVLLDRSTQLPPGPLPSGAYRELSRKPVVEAQLLLMRSVLVGLPDENTAREVSFLAGSAQVDSRVQSAALEALARPSHAPQLAEAVRALAVEHDGSWSGWDESVAPALARCGLACAEAAVQVVAQAPDPSAAASQVMRLAIAPDRGELLERLAPALSDDTLQQIKHDYDL